MHAPDKKSNGKAAEGGEEVAESRDPNLPAALDGGWGWMVVFGSFMIHVIADGIAYSFGVYVEDFVTYFGCSKSAIGGLGSLMIGVTWGAGPIASALTNKFSCRFTAITGTLIAAAGFIVSIFAPNVWFMYFSMGIVAGLGLGLAYLPAIVAVSFYFEKRRSLATGLAVCGSGLGTFIFSPLTEALLDEYSWKGTVLIEAGLLLNCIICGMVFRPLPGSEKKKPEPATPMKEITDGGGKPATVFASATSNSAKTASLSLLPQNEADSEKRQRTCSENWTSGSHKKALSQRKESTSSSGHNLSRPMSRKDVFYSQSLTHIPMYNEDPDKYRAVVEGDAVDGAQKSSCWSKLGVSPEMEQTLNEMLDVSLLCDPVFMLFAISNFLTSVGYVVPYIFLPNRGIRLDFDRTQAAWLISMVGISNTIGRIIFGFIADFKFVNRLLMYNIVLVLCGLVSIFSSLCITFPWMMIYAFFFGLFIGVYTCLTPIVLVDLLGLGKLSNAFGLILLFQGIGAVVGPPFAGWLFDISDNYDNSFYMMGICIAVSGLMLFPIPCIQRLQRRRDEELDVALGKVPSPHVPPVTSTDEELALRSVKT